MSSIADPAEVEPALLTAIDALAHRTSHPGLSGCLALGVRRAGKVVYWVGRFGKELHSEITTTLPASAKASLVLDETDANWILEHGSLSAAPHFTLRGDRRLLARLLAGLGPSRSQLELRADRGAS